MPTRSSTLVSMCPLSAHIAVGRTKLTCDEANRRRLGAVGRGTGGRAGGSRRSGGLPRQRDRSAGLQLPQRRRRARLWIQRLRPSPSQDGLRPTGRRGEPRLRLCRLLPRGLSDQSGRQRTLPRPDMAAAPIGGRLHAARIETAAPQWMPPFPAVLVAYGQVTSIAKGLLTGCNGLAMSIPVAVPEIL